MTDTTKIICPHCKSREVVKRGYFQTEAKGKVQRYFCKSCSKKFIPQTAFYRMRNTPQKITLCLDLFYRGVSTRKVQEHLQAFYPHNSSWVSIYNWVIKYSKQISKFTDKLKVNIGQEVQIDEVEYHRRKSHKAKKGIEVNWLIDSVCPETKFMLNADYLKSRQMKNVKQILNNLISKSTAFKEAIISFLLHKTILPFANNSTISRYGASFVSKSNTAIRCPSTTVTAEIRACARCFRSCMQKPLGCSIAGFSALR